MSKSSLWMVSTKLKALENYGNRINKGDTVFVTAVSQSDSAEKASKIVETKVKSLGFELISLLQSVRYDEDTLSRVDPCIAYGVEEAANEVMAGLPDVAFGSFITQEHIDSQSRMWIVCVTSQPMFEGPVKTDGTESFGDCILLLSATKGFAEAQVKELLLKRGQTRVSFSLVAEIMLDSSKAVISNIDNTGLKISAENAIEYAIEEIREHKQPIILGSVIIDSSNEAPQNS